MDKALKIEDYSLGENRRLKSKRAINDAFKNGLRFTSKYLTLLLRQGDDASLRLAVIAGSKAFHGAVRRNRIRRILREIFRLNRHLLCGKVDVVIIARPSMEKASYRQVESDFLELVDKAGLKVKQIGI